MQTITNRFVLFLCSILISGSVFCQSLDFNIIYGDNGTTSYGCKANTFNVTVTNTTTSALANVTFQLDLESQTIWQSGTITSVPVTTNPQIRSFSCGNFAANETKSFSYDVLNWCTAIPTVANGGNPLIGHKYSNFKSGNTNLTVKVNTVITSTNYTLRPVYIYPFLTSLTSSTSNPGMVLGQTFTRSFIYRNSGTAIFAGNIRFVDPIDPALLTLDPAQGCGVKIYFGNSTTNTWGPAITLAVNSGHYDYDFSAIPLRYLGEGVGNCDFKIEETIKVIGCTPTASSNNTTVNLMWGCGQDCFTATPVTSKTVSAAANASWSVPTPVISYSRLKPSNAAGLSTYVWDQSDMGSSTEWIFVVRNTDAHTGADAQYYVLTEPLVDMNMNDLHSYTYVLRNSLEYNSGAGWQKVGNNGAGECTYNDLAFPQTSQPGFPNNAAVSLNSVTPLSSADYQAASIFPNNGIPNCVSLFNANNSPYIMQAQLKLPNLLPGQQVLLRFKTFRCCSAGDNFMFNQHYIFNRWTFIPSAKNYCGASIYKSLFTGTLPAAAGGGSTVPALGIYDPNANWLGSEKIQSELSDMAQEVYFDQTVSNLLGAEGGCGAAVPISISNVGFAYNLQSGLGTSGALTDAQFFSPPIAGASSHSGGTPRGFFKLEWDMPSGLRMPLNNINMATATVTWPACNVTTQFYQQQGSCAANLRQHVTAYFNVATLINTYPALNTADPFIKFMAASRVNFSLQACCPSDSTVVTCRFRSSFSPNVSNGICIPETNCWMPMAEVVGSFNIRCPGCILPGMSVSSGKMERTTFGYTDVTDDRLADGTGTLVGITNAYSKFSNIRRDRVIVGDNIHLTSSGSFYPGGGEKNGVVGFTYTDWVNHHAPQDVRFKYFYFEFENQDASFHGTSQYISPQNALDDHVNLNIIRNGVTLNANPIVMNRIAIPNNPNHYYYGVKLDNTVVSQLALSDIVSVIPNYEFTPGDVFNVQGDFTVCGNVDKYCGAPIIYGMYLANRETNWQVKPADDLETYMDAWQHNHDGNHAGTVCDPAVQTELNPPPASLWEKLDVFGQNAPNVFWCEKRDAPLQFFKVYEKEMNALPTYTVACGNRLGITFKNGISGPPGNENAENLFPYELRFPPSFTYNSGTGMVLPNTNLQFKVSFPQGWTVSNTFPAATTKIMYGNALPLASQLPTFPIQANMVSNTANPTGVLINFTNLGYAPARTGFLANNNFPLIGDETMQQTLMFDLNPICNTPVNQMVNKILNTDMNVLTNHKKECGTVQAITLNSDFDQGGKTLVVPSAVSNINLVQSATSVANSNPVIFDFIVNVLNPNGFDGFFYIRTADLAFNKFFSTSLNDISLFYGNVQLPPPVQNGDFAVFAIPYNFSTSQALVTSSNGTQHLTLKVKYSSCDNVIDNAVQSFNCYYGMMCAGLNVIPTTLLNQSACVGPHLLPAAFLTPLTQVTTSILPENTSLGCDPIKFSACLTSNQNGGLFEVTAQLNVDPALVLSNWQASALVGGAPISLNAFQVTPQGAGVYNVNLTGSTAFSGGVFSNLVNQTVVHNGINNGESVCIYFDAQGLPTPSGSIAPPTVTFNCKKFCNTPYPLTNPNPLSATSVNLTTPAGNWPNAVYIGGGLDVGFSTIADMKTDKDGNVYSCGYIYYGNSQSTFTLNSTVSGTPSAVQLFIQKHNNCGDLKWKQIGQLSELRTPMEELNGMSLGVDEVGHVYWASPYYSNLTGLDGTNTSYGSNNNVSSFMAIYDMVSGANRYFNTISSQVAPIISMDLAVRPDGSAFYLSGICGSELIINNINYSVAQANEVREFLGRCSVSHSLSSSSINVNWVNDFGANNIAGILNFECLPSVGGIEKLIVATTGLNNAAGIALISGLSNVTDFILPNQQYNPAITVNEVLIPSSSQFSNMTYHKAPMAFVPPNTVYTINVNGIAKFNISSANNNLLYSYLEPRTIQGMSGEILSDITATNAQGFYYTTHGNGQTHLIHCSDGGGVTVTQDMDQVISTTYDAGNVNTSGVGDPVHLVHDHLNNLFVSGMMGHQLAFNNGTLTNPYPASPPSFSAFLNRFNLGTQLFAKTDGSETSGVQVSSGNKEMVLYPNPTNRMLYLAFSDKSEISHAQIFDITGKLLDVIPLSMDDKIWTYDISKLAPGTYLIKASTASFSEQKRFTVLR